MNKLALSPQHFTNTTYNPGSGVQTGYFDFNSIIAILQNFIDWFQTILLTLAVIFILYAAFLYMTSKGDSGKVETAKNVLIYAAIGIGIVLLAYAFVPIIGQLLGVVV